MTLKRLNVDHEYNIDSKLWFINNTKKRDYIPLLVQEIGNGELQYRMLFTFHSKNLENGGIMLIVPY